jgi:ribosome-associated heat shock protein Hsp15
MADRRTDGAAGGGSAPGLRLDKWLWYARFCKSRSLASQLCRDGRVRVNRVVVGKPNHTVRPDDVLTFALGPDVRVIRIVALGMRRGPAPEARALYEDLAPPRAATPAEIVPGQRPAGAGRPTKRDRRDIDRLRGG